MANEIPTTYHATRSAYNAANMGGVFHGHQGLGWVHNLFPSSHVTTQQTFLGGAGGKNSPSTLAHLFTGSPSFHFGS